MKLCSKCKIEKSTNAFYAERKSGRLGSRCKECTKKAVAEWEANHPGERKRNYEQIRQYNRDHYNRDYRDAHPPDSFQRRLRKHGLTHDEYINLVNQQNGLCAICDDALATDIDHDHETGVVRGLLCNNCNRGLGCFRDNLIFLQSAIEYLGVD